MKKLRDFTKAICNHCSYSNSSLEFYETAEWVNFSIESAALFLITIENNRLSQTESHSCLGIFAVAFSLACTIHESLSALDHETFD
jgi:hypothetical protein